MHSYHETITLLTIPVNCCFGFNVCFYLYSYIRNSFMILEYRDTTVAPNSCPCKTSYHGSVINELLTYKLLILVFKMSGFFFYKHLINASAGYFFSHTVSPNSSEHIRFHILLLIWS